MILTKRVNLGVESAKERHLFSIFLSGEDVCGKEEETPFIVHLGPKYASLVASACKSWRIFWSKQAYNFKIKQQQQE